MDTEYDEYITPSVFEDQSRKNYERSSTNYSYYMNMRTGDKASMFSKTKFVYVRLKGCNSEEGWEQREREIKNMIRLYDKSHKSHKKDGLVVHVYLVLKQKKRYYAIRKFVEMHVNDPKEECGFKREVLPITQAETEEKDAEKNDKPANILLMALTVFLETLKIIHDNLLERYKEKNATGGLKYVDVIERINQMLEKSGSIVKGDVDFYGNQNIIDEIYQKLFGRESEEPIIEDDCLTGCGSSKTKQPNIYVGQQSQGLSK
ncbi:hypothetical protein C2G38_2213204 [Gigaspora rosea]|uniref:Uncharacterized protein n=1 Tax=Gigaspora rosea TaxID=44941 RepID=A0A397UGE4_9GLOM|nr:hypothetical protein C2G38_2213204 [Gigaspora rosea]